MASKTKRGAGRPNGTTKRPTDFYQDIFRAVEKHRMQAEMRGGRPSDSQICELVCKQGGLTWILGGDANAIVKWLKRETRASKAHIQCKAQMKRRSIEFVRDANGRVFITWRIQNPRSLRARYSEAKKFAEANGATEIWLNMVRDELGISTGVNYAAVRRYEIKSGSTSQNG